jgi:Flp pilus assembly protein TadD
MLELAGRLAMCAEQYDLAAKHYLALTKRDGDDPQWRQELARSLFAGGKYALAAEALDARTSIKTPPAPAWTYAMLGDCHMAYSRVKEARVAYGEALSRKPKSPALMVKAAQASLAAGDTVSACRIARKALQIAPGGLDATLVLGCSLLGDKKPLDAERVLGPAVMLHPNSVTLMCLMGRCHAASGNSDEARSYYRQAVKLDPKSEVARRLFDQIEQEISANTPAR